MIDKSLVVNEALKLVSSLEALSLDARIKAMELKTLRDYLASKRSDGYISIDLLKKYGINTDGIQFYTLTHECTQNTSSVNTIEFCGLSDVIPVIDECLRYDMQRLQSLEEELKEKRLWFDSMLSKIPVGSQQGTSIDAHIKKWVDKIILSFTFSEVPIDKLKVPFSAQQYFPKFKEIMGQNVLKKQFISLLRESELFQRPNTYWELVGNNTPMEVLLSERNIYIQNVDGAAWLDLMNEVESHLPSHLDISILKDTSNVPSQIPNYMNEVDSEELNSIFDQVDELTDDVEETSVEVAKIDSHSNILNEVEDLTGGHETPQDEDNEGSPINTLFDQI